jgi:2-oxoglutarate dehydrogenase E1 component
VLVRFEQLYPFPRPAFREVLEKYKKAASFLWVQEEPENMGAWSYMLRQVKEVKLTYVGRPESASPATGSHHQHEREQQEILRRAFTSTLTPANEF